MLHIHNGDSSAGTAKQSTIRGEHFAWRESLITGPTPAGLNPSEWRKLRAQHLSEAFGADRAAIEAALHSQEDKLSTYPDHDEVVLWFEHDLFCQINLLYLFQWFAQRDLGQTKLSLICIGEFPGLPDFRGLGELNVEQLTSLLEKRHLVSAAELQLATKGWQAYCSANPSAIEALLSSDTSALPFLERAFQLHLERFPSVRNGLGRIEKLGLELIESGASRFVDLFPRFCQAEPAYGLGDSQFELALRQMAAAQKPLVKSSNGSKPASRLASAEFHKHAFEITETGEAVCRNEADFIELNGIDSWLGGVHLSGQKNLWRWDEQTRRLTLQ
ncbi:MAG: RNA polymerase subunit sigma-24 [Acidobacteriota bacterium]